LSKDALSQTAASSLLLRQNQAAGRYEIESSNGVDEQHSAIDSAAQAFIDQSATIPLNRSGATGNWRGKLPS